MKKWGVNEKGINKKYSHKEREKKYTNGNKPAKKR
jgi:hypothetical protein